MNTIISGKGIVITPSMRTYAEQKCSKIAHFWNSIVRAHVEVSKSRHHKHGEVFMAYAWIEIPGNDIRVSADAPDFHTAIDLVLKKTERLVIKAKGRATRS